MSTTAYTHTQMEAALCLWEAMLEHRQQHVTMDSVWDQWGTTEMRHNAIALAENTEKVWLALDEATREEFVPYDWEFCAVVLDYVTWSRQHGSADLDVAHTVEQLTARAASIRAHRV